MRPIKTVLYCFLYLGLTHFIYAQTPQITVVPPDVGDILSVCEGELLEFTATGGGLFSDPKSYAFYVIRSGTITPTLLRARSDDNTLFIFAGLNPNELQDGDIIFARVWDQTTVDGGGDFSDTGRTIELDLFPQPRPTLFDNIVGHVFCPDEAVAFEVLPNNAPRYIFYRNGHQIQDSSQANVKVVNILQSNPSELLTNYILEIPAPEREGKIQIFNQEGCLMHEFELNISLVGTPNFEYNSLNLQLHDEILPREQVQFTNTSSGDYFEEEWNFGDSSPVVKRPRATSVASPVYHEFLTQGTYNVRLRIFNALGCYEEHLESIAIGQGYHLLFPTVFTPNGDTINDYFRPVHNGFNHLELNIYNSRGQLLYREEVQRTSPQETDTLQGWDGLSSDDSEYFIFSFVGTLPDESKVERSGTFLLLR